MLLKKLSTILIAFSLFSIMPAKATNSESTLSETSSQEKRFICRDCNKNESYVLGALQDQGILDKNALATIMANIKQESQFEPKACESGGKVQYHQCRSGGFGISQWTSSDRYYGLGNYAKQFGGDPSSLETQVKYMFHERDWKIIEEGLKTPGKTINDYMRLANKWLRWGVKGPRDYYARKYFEKLEYSES